MSSRKLSPRPTRESISDFASRRIAVGCLSDSSTPAASPKKDRITHRIEVSSPDQIDDDLKKWLRAAYDLDR
jgi:hypothetical protein